MATKTELAKSYAPADAEGPVRRRWESAGNFHVDPGGDGSPYSILIPPPNVTAALHLGHALNNTLQDVLIRSNRMRGRTTLWMPGTDHAGIATQSVVEKRLLQDGKRRTDFTREQFVELVQQWKDEYEATITEQLRAMGCSCDWARQRFTMDPVCTTAVRAAFFRLFREGLIYRGKRLVNWDPVTRTALADDEVEMKEVDGHMWYLRYPLVPDGRDDGPDHVVVATTRPETMLGDTAVAVNPRDPRAAALRGRRVKLPIVDRVVPIVEDDYVVMPGAADDPKAEFATGFLKVTPGHDPNDWEIGLRHDLPVVNMLDPDGRVDAGEGWDDVSDAARPFIGLSREEARDAVVRWFDDRGLLEQVRPYRHSVGHSYRSHVPIEPYLSDQWYVRVTDERMAAEALRAMSADQLEGAAPPRSSGDRVGDGALTFYPARYARTFQSWHENLRDWCVSRQLWWGHRIPVWSQADTPPDVTQRWVDRATRHPDRLAVADDGTSVHVCLLDDDDELVGPVERDGFERDPDVLDTWFSSALWPLSTMGWPDPARFPQTEGLLERFNPTSVLCTARDIITLWVSRMVMFNRYFRDGVLPFEDVYIHPMIQDGHGQRMSKSLGNGVDPRDIIHSHGADALRFSLCRMATTTQDVRLPVDMVCPHCEHVFHPKETTSPAGYRVAAPRQQCPSCGGAMASGYGIASGTVPPSEQATAARNSSPKFDEGRNFANKLWNASRFALRHLAAGGDDVAGPGQTPEMLVDRWIVSRLHQTLHAVEDALGSYQFNVYADAMYQFIWGDFCDWYLEAIKPTVGDNATQRQVLRTVLDAIMRLLHPLCPFVTETLWPHVGQHGVAGLAGIELPPSELLALADWPDIECSVHDEPAIETFERIQGLVEAIRAARGNTKATLRLLAPGDLLEVVRDATPIVETLAGLEAVDVIGTDPPGDAVPVPFEGRELLLLGLGDHLDRDAERERLGKVVDEKQAAVDRFRGRLGNAKYVENAPPQVVQETRDRLAQAEADLAAARSALEAL